MRGLITAGVFLSAASARFSPGSVNASDKPLVVVYFPEWAVWEQAYRPWDFEQGVLSRQMPVRNWVVNLAFTTFSVTDCRISALDQEASFSKYDDNSHFFQNTGDEYWWMPTSEKSAGAWPQMLALKHQKYPYIKIIPSVGGWSASHAYSNCVANQRDNMVQSISDIVAYFGFDGIDFDWEYPSCPGYTCGCQKEPTCPESSNHGAAGDWENYKSLIKETRIAFDTLEDKLGRRLYITAAIGMNPTFIEGNSPYTDPIPVEWICDNDYLDWINLMTYDYYGSWVAKTGPLAPLYKSNDPEADPIDQQMSVDDSVSRILSKCSRPEKLMLGLATYGKIWAAVPGSGSIKGLYQTSENKAQDTITTNMTWGPWGTWEQGTASFFDIQDTYLPACQRTFDETTKTPSLFCPTNPKDQKGFNDRNPEWATNTFITYEDQESWKYKMEYAKSKGMGGAIIWSAADFGRVGNGADHADILFQGLFDGWYGAGKVTVSQARGLNGASKFVGPPSTATSEYIFPCPLAHTWDLKQLPTDNSPREMYHDWKNEDKWVNPCYTGPQPDYTTKRYPVMDGTMTKDEIGKDIILIGATPAADDSNDHQPSNTVDDDDHQPDQPELSQGVVIDGIFYPPGCPLPADDNTPTNNGASNNNGSSNPTPTTTTTTTKPPTPTNPAPTTTTTTTKPPTPSNNGASNNGETPSNNGSNADHGQCGTFDDSNAGNTSNNAGNTSNNAGNTSNNAGNTSNNAGNTSSNAGNTSNNAGNTSGNTSNNGVTSNTGADNGVTGNTGDDSQANNNSGNNGKPETDSSDFWTGEAALQECLAASFNPVYADGCRDWCHNYNDYAQGYGFCRTNGSTSLSDCIIKIASYCAP